MRIRLVILAAAGLAIFSAGCLGSFAANQGRRQAARSADHYIRTYAEPETDDPAARAEFRQTRNDIADTIVRTGNDRQTTRVGVDDRGWLTNER